MKRVRALFQRQREVAIFDGGDELRAALQRLRDQGVELTRIVDVGAFRGGWTLEVRKTFPAAAALLVEPNLRHADALAQLADRASAPTTIAHRLVGARRDAAARFHVTDDPSGGTGSSMLTELTDVESHTEIMEMVTLGDVLDSAGFGVPDLVKLDVQGYELEGLRGFEAQLTSCRFVMLEVSVRQYNEGAPLMAEIIAWLDARDFVVHDIVGRLREPGGGDLLQLDLLFARTSDPVRETFRSVV